ARWDHALRDVAPEDLCVLIHAFEELVVSDAGDAAALSNRALLLAWEGRNAEAITCLGRAVELEASVAFESAVESWTLAELLRLGAGAEHLADDLNHVWTIDRSPQDDDDPAQVLRAMGSLASVNVESVPGIEPSGLRAFEWLDAPMPDPRQDLSLAELPQV